MSEIRSLTRADLSAVAALFQRTFRQPEKTAPRSLETHCAEAFLDHPWFDTDVQSRVHLDDEGKVTGFVGVFPGQFEFGSRQVRAAIAGTLMVENPEREPIAGARLLRSVTKGPQDITISETTNSISQRLWQPLGGKVVPLMSLDWIRVLRPAAMAVAMLSETHRRGALLAPLARAADSLSVRWTARALKPPSTPKSLDAFHGAGDSEFAAAVVELSGYCEFRPAWSKELVEWLLRQATQKKRYGSAHRTIVRDRSGELAGCYLYHGDARGIGRVLQILARPNSGGDVLDCLLNEAEAAGLAGVRGRSSPQLMNALLTRDCVFLHRASTVIHTRDSELARVVEAGGALITGLAGESWTRLVGDDFN